MAGLQTSGLSLTSLSKKDPTTKAHSTNLTALFLFFLKREVAYRKHLNPLIAEARTKCCWQ